MEKGTYKGRRVDFASYATSCFNPHLFAGDVRNRMGCGPCALALLTGTAPELIARHRRDAHCSDSYMLRFLRRNGFRTLALTLCNLSATPTGIGNDHVLLISQLLRENEGTWVVLFNCLCYHNFEVYSLERLSFLNKPILSAHLVVHPRWQLNRAAKPKPAPPLNTLQPKLTLTALYKSGLGWKSARPKPGAKKS